MVHCPNIITSDALYFISWVLHTNCIPPTTKLKWFPNAQLHGKMNLWLDVRFSLANPQYSDTKWVTQPLSQARLHYTVLCCCMHSSPLTLVLCTQSSSDKGTEHNKTTRTKLLYKLKQNSQRHFQGDWKINIHVQFSTLSELEKQKLKPFFTKQTLLPLLCEITFHHLSYHLTLTFNHSDRSVNTNMHCTMILINKGRRGNKEIRMLKDLLVLTTLKLEGRWTNQCGVFKQSDLSTNHTEGNQLSSIESLIHDNFLSLLY